MIEQIEQYFINFLPAGFSFGMAIVMAKKVCELIKIFKEKSKETAEKYKETAADYIEKLKDLTSREKELSKNLADIQERIKYNQEYIEEVQTNYAKILKMQEDLRKTHEAVNEIGAYLRRE